MKTEWFIRDGSIRLVLCYDKQNETSSGTSGCSRTIASGELSEGPLDLIMMRMWKHARDQGYKIGRSDGFTGEIRYG